MVGRPIDQYSDEDLEIVLESLRHEQALNEYVDDHKLYLRNNERIQHNIFAVKREQERRKTA